VAEAQAIRLLANERDGAAQGFALGAFWYGRAVGLFNRGRFEAALRYMLEATQYDPETANDLVACSVIGRSYLAMNRADQAITFLEGSRLVLRFSREGSRPAAGVR
jgi:hypothetical protein